MNRYAKIVLASVTFGSWSAGLAAEVSFKQAFDAAAEQDVVVIAAQPGDTLVIESGEYVTNGRRLVVSANVARLAGDATFAFFRADSAPAVIPGVAATGDDGRRGDNVNCNRHGCGGDNGKIGKPGAQGATGTSASNMLLDIHTLEGNAKLTVRASGQRGGKGQKAGQGGTGGRGGDGAQRSCRLTGTKAGPGNGGPGGTGGPGGVGGTGGTGGDGGAILLHEKLGAPWLKGLIEVDLKGGAGGDGGDAGEKGVRGTGGGMGRGSECGGGGRGGPDGADGAAGENGNLGADGKQGSLQFSNLEASSDPQALPPDVKAERLRASRAEPPVRDCDNPGISLMETVRTGDERVIVKVLDSAPRGGTGVRRINGLSANISTTDPSTLNITGSIERTRTHDVYIRNFLPEVRRRCPQLQLEIEANVLTVSPTSELGKILTQRVDSSQSALNESEQVEEGREPALE